jgi:hypothetical protein
MSKMIERRRAVARRANEKTAQTDQGRYVQLIQTENNRLEIAPTKGIEQFIELNEQHFGPDTLSVLGLKDDGKPRYNVWGDIRLLEELLDDRTSNGWQWVEPEDIGALTSGPILEAPDGNIYWHERYQIESAADMLLSGKPVRFDGAPENKAVKGKKASGTKVAEEEVPPALPAPVVPTAPVSIPPSMYTAWTTEALSASIKALTGVSDFANDKAAQQAVEAMADELKSRPVEPKEASRRKRSDYGGTPAVNEESNTVLEGDKSLPDSHDHVEDKTGIEKPKTTLPKNATTVNAESNVVLEGDKSIPDSHDHVEDETGVDKPATVLPKNASEYATIGRVRYKVASFDDGKRAYVSLTSSGGRKIFDVWDKTAHELFEDGFINPKRLVASAVEYATMMGLVKSADISDAFTTDRDEKSMELDVNANRVASGTKTAAEMNTAKALKLAESGAEKLKALYLELKPILSVNDTRAVRNAVEGVYQAMAMFEEAQKVLSKQDKQEEAIDILAESQKKPKKSALLSNLITAAEEEEEDQA